MVHDDMLDVKDMLDDWMSKYLGRPVANWPKRDQYLNYVEQDPILNNEKENKTMTTSRERMNFLKKGMLVECVRHHNNDRGYIEAFDYTHTLVGIRMEGAPSYKNLLWVNPNYLHVIATPDGNAVQTLNGPCPKPKKVVYNEEAGVMVVIWMDGQKTIVRPAEDEDMNPYDAFCAAYCKRVFGSNSALKRELEKAMVIEKPKTKKKAAQTPTGELNKAIQRIKDAMATSSPFTTPHDN